MDQSQSYAEYERRFHLAEYLPKHIEGESVFLFGNSRSGKSTIYSGFLENKYMVEKIEGVNCLVPESKLLKKLVSEQNKSCTELPNCQKIQISGKKYMLVDCPGSADNSPMRELLNFYYIQKIVMNSKSVSFLLIILMDEFKGKYSLKAQEKMMLKAFIQLFPNCKQQVTILVNKAPCINPTKHAERKQQVKQAFFEGLKEDPALSSYFLPNSIRMYILEKPGLNQTKFTLPQDIFFSLPGMKFKQFNKADLQAPNLFGGDNFQLKVAHSTKIELYMLSALKIEESIAFSLAKIIEMELYPQKPKQKHEGQLNWTKVGGFQKLSYIPQDFVSRCQKGWLDLIDRIKEHSVERMNLQLEQLTWPKNVENFRDGSIIRLAIEFDKLESKFANQPSLNTIIIVNRFLKIQGFMCSFIKNIYQFLSLDPKSKVLDTLEHLLRLAVFKFKQIQFLLLNFSQFRTVAELNELNQTGGKVPENKVNVSGFSQNYFTLPFDRIEVVIRNCMNEVVSPMAVKIYERFLQDEIKRVDDSEYYQQIDRLYNLILSGCKLQLFDDQPKVTSIYSARKLIMRAYQLLKSHNLSISEIEKEALALFKALPEGKKNLKREIALFTANQLKKADKLEAAVQVFQMLEVNTQVVQGVQQMLSRKKDSFRKSQIDYFTEKAQRLSKLCRFAEAAKIYELLKQTLMSNEECEKYYLKTEQKYCQIQSRAEQEQLLAARKEHLIKLQGQPLEKCFPNFTADKFQAALKSGHLQLKNKSNPQIQSPSGRKQFKQMDFRPQTPKRKTIEPMKVSWRQC